MYGLVTNLDNMSDDIKKLTINFFINNIREKRNNLLLDSDKYLLPDFPISSNNLLLIKAYRQELRDYMNLPEILNYDLTTSLPDLPKFPLDN